MIKRNFQSIERAIAVGFSGDQIHIAVESLDDAGGKRLLCVEKVDDQVLVFADRLHELLDRFELGSGGSVTPLFQVPSCPVGTGVGPEHLEGFLEQVGLHTLEVILHDRVQPGLLSIGEIFGIFGETIFGVLEHFLVALAFHSSGFSSPNLIEGFVEVGDNVETVENVAGLRNLPGDHFQVRLPHVRANVADPGAPLRADHTEEAQQRTYIAFLCDMEQPSAVPLNLVHQSDVVVAPAPLPFIDANGFNPFKIAVFETIVDHRFDRSENRMPAGAKSLGGFLPGKSACPSGEEKLVSAAQGTFPFGPGNLLHFDSTTGTIHPSQSITQVTLEAPDRYELVQTRLCGGVVSGALCPASRTDRLGSASWAKFGHEAFLILYSLESDRGIHKTLEPMAVVEQCLHLHRRSFPFVFFTPATQWASVRLSTIKQENHFFRRKENTFPNAIGRSGGQAGSRIKCPACGAEAAKAAEFMPGSCLRAA